MENKKTIDLIEDLLREEESKSLDFKSEQYRFINASDKDKSELLKDILAFANAWRRDDAYILIGVKEVKGGRSEVLGITEHLEDSDIQQFVNSKTKRPLEFSYKAIEFEGKQIGFFHIPMQRRPFYTTKDYGRVKRDLVYVRRGSSTAVATIDEISKMGLSNDSFVSPVPLIQALLVFGEYDEIIEQCIEFKVVNVTIPTDKELPDYGDNSVYSSIWNQDYYRDLAKYIKEYSSIQAVKLAVKNDGATPARDVKVVIDVSNEEGTSIAYDCEDLLSIPNETSVNMPSGSIRDRLRVPDVSVRKTANGWRISCLIGKVQAKDTVITKAPFFLGAHIPKILNLDTQIYSDDLSETKRDQLTIKIDVESDILTVSDLIIPQRRNELFPFLSDH